MHGEPAFAPTSALVRQRGDSVIWRHRTVLRSATRFPAKGRPRATLLSRPARFCIRAENERQWRKLGHTLDPDDFTDAQAIAAIERITRGNFRLLERLLPQIQRVLRINELDVITNDVIEAARSTLVIGIS